MQEIDYVILFVICSGMYRSASTWSYNIIRTILSNKQTLFSEFNQLTESLYNEKINDYDNILLKCHNLDDFAQSLIKNDSAKLVHTYREPLAAISSGLQTFKFLKFDEIIDMVKIGLDIMEFGKKFESALNINYDEITSNSINIVKKISTHLGYDLKNQDIQNIDLQFKLNKIKTRNKHLSKSSKDVRDIKGLIYDKNTLFFKNHILDNIIEWGEFLSNEQKETAISRLQPFVDESGSLRTGY